MLKQRLLTFIKRFYPFLLLIPFVLLVLFFVFGIFARDIVINPEGSPFPKGSKYANDQIIVKYKNGQSPEALKKDGKTDQEKSLAESLRSMGVLSQERLFTSVDEFLKNYYLLLLKPGTDIQELYKRLTGVPEIDSVTPDYILDTFPKDDTGDVPTIQSPIGDGEPNDPYYLDGQQWDMNAIEIKNAWNITRANNDVLVAVIDTGVDYNHPDLIGRVVLGKNFINDSEDPLDDHGHGTHVAGTIGAITNNGIGISSTSWGAKILAIKACDNNGDCVTSNVVRGVSYALEKGAKIINISIAGVGSCRKENFFSGDRVYEDVIRDANSRGSIVIVAAGNHNQDAVNEVPGACEGVISVAATNNTNTRWFSNDSSGSNFGSKIDIAAPGASILSTSINQGYSIRNGTSMAAPHVSGVAALLLSHNKDLTLDQMKNCLISSSKKITSDNYIAGLLNAPGALTACGAKLNGVKALVSPSMIPTLIPTSVANNNTIPDGNYSVSGTIFIDQNGNEIFDGTEKTLGGVQVILSPAEAFTSVLANPQGFFLFNNIAPNTYLVSLTVPGVSSVNLPTRTVTIDESNKNAVINIPVSPLALPSPSVVQKNSSITPSISSTSPNAPPGCYYDPGCFENTQSIKACSFTCN